MSPFRQVCEGDKEKGVGIYENADGNVELHTTEEPSGAVERDLLELNSKRPVSGMLNPLNGFTDRILDSDHNATGPVAFQLGGLTKSALSRSSGTTASTIPASMVKDFPDTGKHHASRSPVNRTASKESAKDGYLEIGPNENCDRDCVECLPQFKTASMPGQDPSLVVEQVDDVKASLKAKTLAELAEKDRRQLQAKISQHGDAIKKKWKKISQEKRRSVILEAQPTLYEKKWPELRAMFGYNRGPFSGSIHRIDARDTQRLAELLAHNKKLKNGSLTPFLNVETLTEDPMRLLALLHYRSEYDLQDFVMLDAFQMRASVENGNLSREYNENCVIMFGDEYGKLVQWDRAQCHRWNCIGYPRAVLVLEAQAMLLTFLWKVANIIVPSESSSKTGDHDWKDMVAAGFKTSSQIEYWSSLGNQPFSTPPSLDASEALTKARAQLRSAEDHLRFLQTDPAYFHRLIAQQRRGEHYARIPVDKIWTMIAADVMVFPIQHVQRLRDLVDECEHVLHMQKKYKGSINVGGTLPKEYQRALGALEHVSVSFYQAERMQLEKLMRASPGFHRNHRYVTLPDGRHGSLLRPAEYHATAKETNEAFFRKEPLLYGLYNLCKNPEDIDAISIPFLMNFIEDTLAHADYEDRKRVDQTLYDHLSRMAVYGEIFTLLRMTRPLSSASAFSYDNVTEGEKQRSTWRKWGCTPGNLTDTESKKLCTLLAAFYEHPMPVGKKNADWLAKSDESRKRLADFWTMARQVRRHEVAGIGLGQQDLEEDVALFAADQSEEYKAELAAEKPMAQQNTSAACTTPAMPANDAVPQTTWGRIEEKRFELVVGRHKPKTRPINASQIPDGGLDHNDHDVGEEKALRMAVNSQSLRVFARLFPSAAGAPSKGVINWKDFVMAMADAGCSATHTGGSAVSFGIKTEGGESGTIVFHKPHPEPEIDNVMLHTMGKRLRKWFGWHGETFVGRKKES